MPVRPLRELRRDHPAFFRAVAADARTSLAYRSEPFDFVSKTRLCVQIVRLTWVSDAFLAQVMYRAKARLQYFRIPIVPTLLHRFAMMHSQVCIGLKAGNFQGPTVNNGVHIGTGAKVIGPITIGAGAVIGANAVVVSNVEAGQTVGGVPARPLR